MSLVTQVSALATRIGTEFKTLRATLGANANLTTTAKQTLVDAINEVNAKPTSAGGPAINDTTASGTSVYSSTKTDSQIAASAAQVKTDLIGGASAAYDTLKEIQTELQSDTSGVASLTTAVGNRVRFDAAQTLTSAQQTQAQTNMGAQAASTVGDTTTDFAGQFVTALS
jgi:hypothetical protein